MEHGKYHNVYKFDELSDKAKEHALEKFSYINVDHDWWESTYDDAKNVGIEITSFDIDRASYCKGTFVAGSEECAHKIEKEHGEICETYKTAKAYLAQRDKIISAAPKDDEGELLDEWALDQELDKADEEFLLSILEDYRIILTKEYEHLTSEEAIKDTFEANEYEFDENGNLEVG